MSVIGEADGTPRRHRESASVADVLAFESWPEEQRRVARAAVTLENDDAPDALVESRYYGRLSMEKEATDAYGSVVAAHAALRNRWNEIKLFIDDNDGKNGANDLMAKIERLFDELPSELEIGAEE